MSAGIVTDVSAYPRENTATPAVGGDSAQFGAGTLAGAENDVENVVPLSDEIAADAELAGDYEAPAGFEVVGAFQSAWSADAV